MEKMGTATYDNVTELFPDRSQLQSQVRQQHVACDIASMAFEGGYKPALRKLDRGAFLYRPSDAFKCLYSIRCGFLKTSFGDVEGHDQVTGFHMSREILGLDGLGQQHYKHSAVALEDSEVYAISYAQLEKIGRSVPQVQQRMQEILVCEIARTHDMMLLLGSLHAQERLATFLINLSERFMVRGYSGSEFILRMTRQEIGSYIGLKLETVSRIFTRFHERGLIEVRQKYISIIDLRGLKRILKPLN